MEEAQSVNLNLLKAAKISTLIMMLLVLGQAMSGVGRFTTTLDLDASHVYSAQLGLVLGILTVVAIIMSKTEDKKLKGFGFEIATFWLIMYGIGEMISSNGKLAMLHAPIGMLMFARLMMMAKAFPSEEAE
jgi:hypothetical protein